MSKIAPQVQSLLKETLGLQNEDEKIERRYHYIRIKNIEKVHQQIHGDQEIYKKQKKTADDNKKGDHKLMISMGLRKSDTRFTINQKGNLVLGEKKRLKRQAHMFCYQADEVMNITIAHSKAKQTQMDNQDYQKGLINKPIGFAKVLLTPFISIPQTKHTITVNMVLRSPQLEIYNQIAAVITLQLYFLIQFKAKMFITPVSANLNNNIAAFGQMRPGLIFQINKQRKKSLIVQKGGIHPDWEDYSRIVGEQMKKQMAPEKQLQKQQIRNQFQFDLISAGHELKIKVIDYPLIGSDARLIGESIIKIQECSFFKTPRIQFTHKNKHAIKLFYVDQQKNIKDAGSIVLKTLFDYDDVQIRRQIDSDSEQSDGWNDEQ